MNKKRSIKSEINQLKEQVSREPLTNLYNKVSAFELIDKILSSRSKRQHAMVVFDLDNFKKVNDIFGHAVGDKVLVYFANVLRKVFRTNDILSRFGGDEFIAFLPDVTSVGAVHKKIEEIIGITRTELGKQYQEIQVSVSAGLAISEDKIDAQTLFEHADAALYDAKRNGKSRVSIYEGEEMIPSDYKEAEYIERYISAGTGIFKIYPERLEIMYFSDTLPEFLGYEVEDFYQLQNHDAWKIVFPNDLKKLKQEVKDSLKNRKAFDVICRMRHRNGRILWVQAVGEEMNYEDSVPTIYVLFHNISKHMDMYHEILNASDDVIHLCDVKTRELLYANTAACEFSNQEEGSYLGKKCYQWMFHRDQLCDGCNFSKTLEDGFLPERRWVSDEGKIYSLKGKVIHWEGRQVVVGFLRKIPG